MNPFVLRILSREWEFGEKGFTFLKLYPSLILLNYHYQSEKKRKVCDLPYKKLNFLLTAGNVLLSPSTLSR